MTGKFARSNGIAIDIPLIGENPGGVPNCGQSIGSFGTMGYKTMIPGMTPIYQGYRSMISMTMVATPPITYTMFANPRGCISITAAVVATAPGAGAAFQMPSMAFSRPFPGTPVAANLPGLPNAAQLATSFKVTGPPMSLGTGCDAPNGTMGTGMNTAMFRSFHKSAWLSQTGRAGAMFTWCFGNPNCTMASQAKGYPNTLIDPAHQLIVKYTPGANKFGGTMSHIITAGPNRSSIAITVAGAVQFLLITGMGSQPTGRGYADFLTDPLKRGPAYAMFMTGRVYDAEQMTTQYRITTVMTRVPGSGTPIATNKNFGFPFTTGTVLARATGRDIQNNPAIGTLTGMGGDAVTAMGARNISLVAGAVAGVDLLSTETPGLNQMFLPEPRALTQWFAGAVALLGIAVWRSRRVR